MRFIRSFLPAKVHRGVAGIVRRLFGSSPEQLRSLAKWLLEQKVEEVVTMVNA
jgi:hypothetical protein